MPTAVAPPWLYAYTPTEMPNAHVPMTEPTQAYSSRRSARLRQIAPNAARGSAIRCRRRPSGGASTVAASAMAVMDVSARLDRAGENGQAHDARLDWGRGVAVAGAHEHGALVAEVADGYQAAANADLGTGRCFLREPVGAAHFGGGTLAARLEVALAVDPELAAAPLCRAGALAAAGC